MDAAEVTNADYLAALQWALGQGLITATATTVMAHGVELVDLDDIDCEIAFNPATQQFSLVARSHATDWGGPGPAYPDGYDPARHPAKEMTWYGAACYCDWRSLQEGLTPFYNGNWATDATHDPYTALGYRLPTEAEWEYTARYNDNRLYPWGAAEPVGCNYANLNCVFWTRPVGLYPLGASALGFLDLIGNILEYTNDRYNAAYTAESVNPIGPAAGTTRVCRGSDCGNAPLVYAQATTRQQYGISNSNAWMGFRTVRCEEESAPVAIFSLNPANGSTWTSFMVNGGLSSDGQTPADLLEVRWDWTNDGIYDTEWSTGKEASHCFGVIGSHTIRMQVRDGVGLTAECTQALTVSAANGLAVQVPAGTFVMGSPNSEAGRNYDEVQHSVTLTQAFLLGATEVTVSQYRAAALWAVAQGYATLAGSTLSAHGQTLATLPATDSDLPMANVSWYGAACYTDWLCLMEGQTPFYNGTWDASASHNPYLHMGYRLPTEAEWEYACRGGSTTAWCFGNSESLLGGFAWYVANSGGAAHTVSLKQPNAWGLYDLHGNAWEWCQDYYGTYGASATDPLGASSGSYRVFRGGGWNYAAEDCRSANRGSGLPSGRNNDLGFRLARSLP